ncbi:MAG: hypothetical protein ABIQ02_07535 [Saprospiraceae bacterium]
MTDQPDYTEASAIFQKSMQDVLANLDKVREDAKKAHEVAIDLQIAAQEEMHRIEREARHISQNYIDKHRKEFEERIRNKFLLSTTKKLILHGMKPVDIMAVLDVSQKMIAQAWDEVGFSKLGGHIAHVAYEDQGRAGKVIFYREDVMLKFWYEFGGGLSLAFVNVPTAQNWTTETHLPVEDRLPILNFIGARILRDQANGYRYEIKDSEINITL